MKRILILFCLISQVTFAQTNLQNVTALGATTDRTVEFQNTAAFRIKGNLGSPAYGLLDQTANGGPVWRFGNADNVTGYGNFDIFNESAQIVGLRITNTGNVGIGTGTPSSYYHGGNNKALEIFNTNTDVNSQSHLILSTGSLTAGSVGSISWMSPRASGNIGIAYIGAVMPNDVTYHASGELAFATADQGIPLVKMRLTANGNLGIGTQVPPYKLTVNGTLAARKVKVTQDAWADFVFEDHYALPTLQSVEAHIKAKKHLPGIPSAGDIAEKGMDLGDMQQKQMQKIEELTLYVIELNKKLAAQQEVITQLEKAVKFPKKQ
jgi:hypothetical protein